MNTRENLLKQANTTITNIDRAGGTELFVKTAVIASAMCDETITPYTVSIVLSSMQMSLISCKQFGQTTEADWANLVKDISYAASFATNSPPSIRVKTNDLEPLGGMPKVDFNLQDIAVKMADQLGVGKA